MTVHLTCHFSNIFEFSSWTVHLAWHYLLVFRHDRLSWYFSTRQSSHEVLLQIFSSPWCASCRLHSTIKCLASSVLLIHHCQSFLSYTILYVLLILMSVHWALLASSTYTSDDSTHNTKVHLKTLSFTEEEEERIDSMTHTICSIPHMWIAHAVLTLESTTPLTGIPLWPLIWSPPRFTSPQVGFFFFLDPTVSQR